MIKSLLILASFSVLLFSSQQIVLVVADDFHTSRASLELYEDDNKIFSTIVNIGKNGLAWGLGEIDLVQKKDEPQKKEGDKKAPIGVFKLSTIFGYKAKSNYKLPYLYASDKLICVDDSKSNYYNQLIIKQGDEKSFEEMRRKDMQYELGVFVEHNKLGKPQAGSCIFLHVEEYPGASTLGCVSMRLDELKKIVQWLDKDKNPILIQIPKSSAKEILKLYPQLKNSTLLF